MSGEFNFSDIAFIPKELDQKMKSSRVQIDDVLLNITGASIGRCAVYKDRESANVNQHVCIIKVNDNLEPDFLCEFINSIFGQQQIQLFQAGGNREGLNFANIKTMSIPNYNISEQRQISNRYRLLIKNINRVKSKIANSKALQKNLINQIF